MSYPTDHSRRRDTIRGWIGGASRWPALMLVIGLCTTTLTLLMQAFAYDAYQRFALVAIGRGPLAAALLPSAFIVAGLLLAARNAILRRR